MQLIEWMKQGGFMQVDWRIFATKKMTGYTDYMLVNV